MVQLKYSNIIKKNTERNGIVQKLICLVAICITTGLLFTSCGKAPENINPQKYSLDNFKILIEAGDYAKAGEMYFNAVSGNLQSLNSITGRYRFINQANHLYAKLRQSCFRTDRGRLCKSKRKLYKSFEF